MKRLLACVIPVQCCPPLLYSVKCHQILAHAIVRLPYKVLQASHRVECLAAWIFCTVSWASFEAAIDAASPWNDRFLISYRFLKAWSQDLPKVGGTAGSSWLRASGCSSQIDSAFSRIISPEVPTPVHSSVVCQRKSIVSSVGHLANAWPVAL